MAILANAHQMSMCPWACSCAGDVPRLAAQVLGAIATPASLAVLVTGLRSANPLVRRNAALLLGYASAPGATSALVRIARNEADPGVREEAERALPSRG